MVDIIEQSRRARLNGKTRLSRELWRETLRAMHRDREVEFLYRNTHRLKFELLVSIMTGGLQVVENTNENGSKR